ncbi:MAG: hypothetical protein COV66_13180 [Nitrospinae bacterium CG11_big_fil_rev_8_21_14_0_20_45_15]|nr:MAG: hypothetical protein COV66_13180 [Nitrospinae bacterium CG11_big_fil_rev_8_21_14_0_20_45_15]
METQQITERGKKEREQYNQGLKRTGYENFLDHCRYFYIQRRMEKINEAMKFAQGKNVLEIGSSAWMGWLERYSIYPASLTCINISEAELQLGKDSAVESKIVPRFVLMDAHHLQFEDNSFDLVFGGAILHHLNMVTALNEINRVLKPGGRILFVEPLGMNPFGNIVRALTPDARTIDEQPFRRQELMEINKRFETEIYYEEFLSVPLGILSRIFFRDPSNSLMRFAFRADKFLDRNFGWTRNWFRHVLILGKRK